jgi:hypothetical protein
MKLEDAELFAAWESNLLRSREGGGEKTRVTGVLVDCIGAVMFRLDAQVEPHAQAGGDGAAGAASLLGSIVCSEYMSLLDTSGAGGALDAEEGLPIPGQGLGIWLNRIMVAALPECAGWDEVTWAAQCEHVQDVLNKRRQMFMSIADALRLCK